MCDSHEACYSHSDQDMHVICRNGRFYEDVPDEILELGPWAGRATPRGRGLKPEYRTILAGNVLCWSTAKSRISNRMSEPNVNSVRIGGSDGWRSPPPSPRQSYCRCV
jgi:hypothetical protein